MTLIRSRAVVEEKSMRVQADLDYLKARRISYPPPPNWRRKERAKWEKLIREMVATRITRVKADIYYLKTRRIGYAPSPQWRKKERVDWEQQISELADRVCEREIADEERQIRAMSARVCAGLPSAPQAPRLARR